MAKRDLEELKNILDEIKPINDELNAIKANANIIVEDLVKRQNDSIKKENIISENFESIEELKENAEKSAKQIPTWEENITTFKEDIAARQVEYSELKKQLEILKSDGDKVTVRNNELVKTYEHQVEENALFQTQIQATIEDANRHGMAGSFKKRKDELNRSLILWGVATIVSIGLLIFLSSKVLLKISNVLFRINKVL